MPWAISAACVLPPNGWLATAGEDGWACIWNAKEAKKLFEVKAHEGGVLCITSFPNGKCCLPMFIVLCSRLRLSDWRL